MGGKQSIEGYEWFRLDSDAGRKIPLVAFNVIKNAGIPLRNGQGKIVSFKLAEGSPTINLAVMRGFEVTAFGIAIPDQPGPLYFTNEIKYEDLGNISSKLSEIGDRNIETQKGQEAFINALKGIGIGVLVLGGLILVLYTGSTIRYIVKGNK